MIIMKNSELCQKAINVAKNYKTLYVMGCFGAPMNAKNKKRYSNNCAYNRQASRTKMIMNASNDTFGFDCVNLIKGLCWKWSGDKNKVYGGAEYESNGLPDISIATMTSSQYAAGQSSDFSKIEKGELVYIGTKHIGIYIGDGLAVEATPAWDNKVQITAVGNIGKKSGYNTRKWDKHCKAKFIEYVVEPQPTPTPSEKITLPKRGYFKKGDRGEDIKKIDQWLYEKYGNRAVLGNVFGNNTVKEVKKFQKEAKANGTYTGKGATIDGNIGPMTLKAMRLTGFPY